MADESSTGSSDNMKKEKLPVKAIFNKTIETSSNFLTDIWKPRDQVDDQDDLKKSCPETDPPNITHGKSGTKNCLAIAEEFDNGFDSDSDLNSLPFDYSCDEKEYYNDFDSLKSYKGTESRPRYCLLAFLRPIEDDNGEGPSPFQVLNPAFGGRDTDDSTEDSSESFYERRPVVAILSYVGDKDRHSEMRAKGDTSGQKMGWQSLVKPSRPPPKPPRKSDTHPEVNQLKISFSVNGGGGSLKVNSSVGTEVTDSPETDKSTIDVKKTDSVTESGVKHHKIKANQTVTETSHSVSTEKKTATDGIHTDLIQLQFFRQTGFSKQPNLSQSLPASNKHKTSHSEAEQHKLSLSVSFNSKNNQDSSLNPTSSSECDKKTFDLDQNELPGNKLESSTVQHDSSGGSLSSKLASRQSSHGSSFSPSSYKFEDEDDFDNPYDYVTACEEPIHKQKHSHDPFYQKEPSLYDDLEDSDSYSPYDTGLHPDNDNLHYTHSQHDSHHHQCNHEACHSFTKNQHKLYHLANSEKLEVHDVVPDGNCMFRAIVDQMRMQGEITMTCNQIRQMAVENLRENPLQEDGTHIEDFFVAADCESWEQYLKRMSKDGEWGDQIILRGLSEVIHREICIISIIGDGHNQISIVPKEKQGKIYLGHVNDQHYYSLRPKGWNHIWYKEARKICMLRNKEKEQRSLDNNVSSVESEQDLTPPCRNSKLINCNNQYYDEYSNVPVFHLTFIMENVIEKSNLITGHKCYGNNMTHEDNLRSTFEFVGSVEEDLAVNLYALNIQSLQGIGNEDFNAPKVSMNPNFYKIIDTQNVVFQHDSYEINSDIYVINSENTNPGYTRLHITTKHHSHTCTYHKEINGTHYLTTSQFITPKSKYPDMDKPPSYSTFSPFKKCQNIYLCYKCPRWPDQTREWISRNRPSGWPQKSLLKEVEALPCVLTPNSHPCSNEPDVEWMFDFSFPERFLLKENISKEQRYCFHVFKLLIDFHTGRMEELSTFVLKTIFLYTLEVLPQLQWDNCPSACVLYMIEILLVSLKERKIPHYFLPENNIIEHFSGGLIYSLMEKVNAVREFPIMSIIIMAESHGVMSTYITDQIIEDLNHYSTHNGIQDSILHTFVPAYTKIISISLALRKFRQSANAAVSGYKMLQDLFQGNEGDYNPYKNMSLFMFIRQAIDDSIPLYQVWWLCFFIDYYKKTNTLSSFTHTNPFKKISDMMDGFPPGDLDDISVPNHVLSYGQKGNMLGPDLEFLLTMCQFLISEHEFQQVAHYLRGLIHIVNKKIKNPESFMPECIPGYEERMGYVMQSMISSLYNNLLWLLNALFMCYQKQQQTEYFQEYIEQLESVCDILASPSSYEGLAKIWRALGNRKKMNEAITKQRCLQG